MTDHPPKARRRASVKLAAALAAPLVLAASVTAAAPAAAPRFGPDAVYELRTYHVAPGKLDELNARFRDHTLQIFARHGMTSVAYWTVEDAAAPTLVYMLAFPSREAREAAWTAFRADPEWQAVAKASEANGKLVEKVDSVFLRMTDYSPHLERARP